MLWIHFDSSKYNLIYLQIQLLLWKNTRKVLKIPDLLVTLWISSIIYSFLLMVFHIIMFIPIRKNNSCWHIESNSLLNSCGCMSAKEVCICVCIYVKTFCVVYAVPELFFLKGQGNSWGGKCLENWPFFWSDIALSHLTFSLYILRYSEKKPAQFCYVFKCVHLCTVEMSLDWPETTGIKDSWIHLSRCNLASNMI